MHEQKDPRPRRAAKEAGFALILAILALMLLTFLGLTLAATTSTELQIATNYRWSQQALYNAEAGLEVAKVVLGFGGKLPDLRSVTWKYGVTGSSGGPPSPTPVARTGLRDYEMMGCADRAGVGYGRVLTVGAMNYQDVSQFGGTTLNGAFTLWVRRDLTVNAEGQFTDSTASNVYIVTAEGVAPYTGGSDDATRAFIQAHQARRVLEIAYQVQAGGQGTRCQGLQGQEGLAASGENFDPCAPLTAAGVAAAFGNKPMSDKTDVQ
jgi:hypothetical protein